MTTASKRHLTVQIDDRIVTARPRETLLEAALRSGIDFPNSCRVGGCGTCKCKVTRGHVRELTETGYLLTADEIEHGYVLACQAVPTSDVQIATDDSPRGVRGTIVGQEKVTHDITRLRAVLERPIAYTAGQFANVRFEDDLRLVRSYSFATPADASGEVTFFVRKVEGGRVSSKVADEALVGTALYVDGPRGDFWLRSSDAPLLLVAGGSGLAPILAMLKEAVANDVSRPVTLLFGVREERDLYALDEIEAVARSWRGEFRFVPFLSAAHEDSAWSGERGLVTEKIPSFVSSGAHAYLCGPPAMVDAAVAVLAERRISNVHFDRFTTRADALVTTPAESEQAESGSVVDVLHYLKYFLFHGIGLLAVAGLLAGGSVVTGTLVSVLVLYILGDAALGDDTSTPTLKRRDILTAQLWLALPLLALILFVAVWSVASGDPLGFGQWVTRIGGYDVLAARAGTTLGHHVSAWVLTGLMIGMVGTIPGHELTHRTWDSVSMRIGRWLLAFSFDTSFAVEHVYGHHRYVSTLDDPATAPRGRNVYVHVLVSTWKGNVSAWRIEARRLAKRRLPVWSAHNAVLRGYLMSAVLVALAAFIGGAPGALFFVACALWGKALLEIVNYMEHYGMVRNPETPVEPRHSWNTNRRVSSWTMFNLTRHSHHHAQGEVAYHDLKPYEDAPMMINGYLTTIVVAMIPPLWHALMTKKVLAWDREYATAEERGLAAAANARSGVAGLVAANDSGRSALPGGRGQSTMA